MVIASIRGSGGDEKQKAQVPSGGWSRSSHNVHSQGVIVNVPNIRVKTCESGDGSNVGSLLPGCGEC